MAQLTKHIGGRGGREGRMKTFYLIKITFNFIAQPTDLSLPRPLLLLSPVVVLCPPITTDEMTTREYLGNGDRAKRILEI